jgi:hypothetical protein
VDIVDRAYREVQDVLYHLAQALIGRVSEEGRPQGIREGHRACPAGPQEIQNLAAEQSQAEELGNPEVRQQGLTLEEERPEQAGSEPHEGLVEGVHHGRQGSQPVQVH